MWHAARRRIFMVAPRRLTISIDKQLYGRLLKLTERRKPRLPKRYVIELALKRLLDAAEEGQVGLGLESDGAKKTK
jgi:hypothetical protein